MQKTHYSTGPKFFEQKSESWFDEGDRCSPGPGAHQNVIMNKTNPPVWSTSKDDERDTFLQKHHRAVPSPDRYKVVNVDVTHQKQPSFSVPIYEPKQNPNKLDEGSAVDYQPRFNAPKQKYPDYSFGYYFERDYSTKVPPPNAYNSKLVDKSSFNKTQRSFSVSARPTPYGEQAKYPYVGKYNVGGDLQGSKFSIGRSSRPDYYVGAGADNIYNVSNNILGQGKTMGLLIEVPRNKDLEDFPSPDKYNPNLPKSERNIINYRSKRSQIKNQAVQNNPSPQKYEPKIPEKQQTVSFTKEKRHSPQPNQNPGVGTYRIEKQFQKTLGNMGLKLKKLPQFVNPAPSAYDPKHVLTKPKSQQPINYYSDRTDFSKSVTGKKVGPGVYKIQKQTSLNLGKFGKGYKFEPNRNKNPGPGCYEIRSGIGKLPKYCNGPKKLTDTGFSFIQLQRQERIRSERQKYEARMKVQQQEQQRKLQQLQQKELAAKMN